MTPRGSGNGRVDWSADQIVLSVAAYVEWRAAPPKEAAIVARLAAETGRPASAAKQGMLAVGNVDAAVGRGPRITPFAAAVASHLLNDIVTGKRALAPLLYRVPAQLRAPDLPTVSVLELTVVTDKRHESRDVWTLLYWRDIENDVLTSELDRARELVNRQ